MPADMHRVILAGVQAALEESRTGTIERKGKRHLPAGRALLLGAGLVTAARVAASARGRGMLGTIQNGVTRLQDRLLDDTEDDEDLEEGEDEEDFEEPQDEEDLEEPEEEDEPEDEEDLEE